MKKNWIKIGLVFVLAIGILSIGIVMKWNQGYIMDSDENIRLAMADCLNKSENEVMLLDYYKYQEDNMNIIIGMSKIDNGYALCMFEEKSNLKYKCYYTYNPAGIDDNIFTFRDQIHDIYILATYNSLNKIKHLEFITNDGSLNPEILSYHKKYILRCYPNQNDNILGVSPTDESGNSIENITISEDTIR